MEIQANSHNGDLGAEGLAALHNCDQPIIQGDIKSTIVFAAADFTPKIARFDMAVQSYGPSQADTVAFGPPFGASPYRSALMGLCARAM